MIVSAFGVGLTFGHWPEAGIPLQQGIVQEIADRPGIPTAHIAGAGSCPAIKNTPTAAAQAVRKDTRIMRRV